MSNTQIGYFYEHNLNKIVFKDIRILEFLAVSGLKIRIIECLLPTDILNSRGDRSTCIFFSKNRGDHTFSLIYGVFRISESIVHLYL